MALDCRIHRHLLAGNSMGVLGSLHHWDLGLVCGLSPGLFAFLVLEFSKTSIRARCILGARQGVTVTIRDNTDYMLGSSYIPTIPLLQGGGPPNVSAHDVINKKRKGHADFLPQRGPRKP